MRLYSLLETNIDIDQFLKSIHRYVQLAIHVKGYMSAKHNRFHREIVEVCEFYVTSENEAKTNILYKKNLDGKVVLNNPSQYLIDYFGSQGITLTKDYFLPENDVIEVL
jgi:hypothetical protein